MAAPNNRENVNLGVSRLLQLLQAIYPSLRYA